MKTEGQLSAQDVLMPMFTTWTWCDLNRSAQEGLMFIFKMKTTHLTDKHEWFNKLNFTVGRS
ncbi:hypothetical protein [Chengkuizengella marina]|uniref:Uncharacterized protein n=1 Tax=Chengkuizengella marina TaxID=2507566 RepID=A0A6N9Q888_9BACL|nr:hypothetical protein [Chengkuizengella marina]NBI31078.1 hypothetical protein [Chengkuizengella marina]